MQKRARQNINILKYNKKMKQFMGEFMRPRAYKSLIAIINRGGGVWTIFHVLLNKLNF